MKTRTNILFALPLAAKELKIAFLKTDYVVQMREKCQIRGHSLSRCIRNTH